MTGPVRWEDTVAGQLGRAMRGIRPGTPEPVLRGRGEAESRELRDAWERQMDEVDRRLNFTGPDTWRARRRQGERVAAEARERGQWFSSLIDCPECRMEETGRAEACDIAFEGADHHCRIEDLRLEIRLRDMMKLSQVGMTSGIPYSR